MDYRIVVFFTYCSHSIIKRHLTAKKFSIIASHNTTLKKKKTSSFYLGFSVLGNLRLDPPRLRTRVTVTVPSLQRMFLSSWLSLTGTRQVFRMLVPSIFRLPL